MRTTNKKSRELVENMVEFKASNLSAEWKHKSVFNACYVVLSYKWYPILAYHPQKGWFRNKDGYSQSTKRQIAQATPLDVEVKEVPYEELKAIIDSEV